MKLKTAKRVFAFSKFLLCAGLVSFVAIAIFCVMGRVEFKYLSLPVMACFIAVTWLATTKAAIGVMEAEGKEGE